MFVRPLVCADDSTQSGSVETTSMVQRVTYGALAIAVVFTVIASDVAIARSMTADSPVWGTFGGRSIGGLLERGSTLPIVYLIASLIGAREMVRLLRARGHRPHVIVAYPMIVVLVLSPWFASAGWLGTTPVQLEGLQWQIVWLLVAALATASAAVLRREPETTFRDVGATALVIFYLGFLTSFGVHLRCGYTMPGEDGAWLLLIALLVTKASDIGAYLVGTVAGRHQLIPSISPGKTVEGAIGGLVMSALVALMFVHAETTTNAFVGVFSSDSIGGSNPTLQSVSAEPDPPLLTFAKSINALAQDATARFAIAVDDGSLSPSIRALVFGLLLSLFGQIGDLFESSFKRDARIKDSGHLIPSYGGILDLMDSPALAVPLAWVLLTVVWGIV